MYISKNTKLKTLRYNYDYLLNKLWVTLEKNLSAALSPRLSSFYIY